MEKIEDNNQTKSQNINFFLISTNQIQEKPNESIYTCERCSDVPEIQLLENGSISINCNNKKHHPFTKEITLSEYSDTLKNLSNKKSILCDSCKNNHINKEAVEFCSTCDQNFCGHCLLKHNEIIKNHLTIKISGFKIQPTCQEEGCGRNIHSFCFNCLRHICEKCKEFHKEHKLINLNTYLTKEDLDSFNKDLAQYESDSKEEIKSCNKVADVMKEALKLWEEYIKNRVKQNALIMEFLNSILNSYIQCMNYPNYFIMKNIKTCQISNIQKMQRDESQRILKRIIENNKPNLKFPISIEERKKEEKIKSIINKQNIQIEELQNYQGEIKYSFKIILIGESNIGKTGIFIRIKENIFPESFLSTSGVDIFGKIFKINEDIIKVELWDTAGQERFRAITKNYYKIADGVLYVLDLTNRETLDLVESWCREIREEAKKDLSLMVLGNKADLIEKREITKEEGKLVALTVCADYMETSAKENINIKESFYKLITQMYIKKIKPFKEVKLGGRKKKEGNCVIY